MKLAQVDLERFQTLIEINALINSDFSDLRAVLKRIVESATRLTEGEASSLLLVNPQNNRLYFEVALGSKGAQVQKFSLEIGEGIAGWVAQHNRSLIVNDTGDDPRHRRDIGQQIGYATNSILAVPMRIKDECVGVIEILNKKGNKLFNQDDLEWLEIFANQAAMAVQNARTFQKVRNQVDLLRDQVNTDQGYHTLVWKSPEMEEQLSLVDRIAPTDSTVLILGESGVGKELIAEQIHLRSQRAQQPFIRVNCAALPPTLLESELFGHVKGAFTDAVSDRRGRFEVADKGTIFLDEIGDVPLPLQAKMLRVIQERTFEPLGSSESITVNVRIIAATNKKIEELVETGEFRSDLYYRLNVLPLNIPPLRQRREDIIELANFFLRRFVLETNKRISGFTDEALEAMISYDWPGNVRELENAVERAVVICQQGIIYPEDLLLRGYDTAESSRYQTKGLKEGVTLFKKQFIRSALDRNSWNHTATAEELGIQRSYLSKLVKDLDLKRKN
ncbi:Fis family transcriptional regulator [Alkalispirochaeta sphaeroplastigenens]|uniref:Fis family transcriptional regulator n=1 Tax=Alkalispirochaeta sphaeroplastigenens TaxID=1187066 RepID=A0A2S4K0D3_9SPIO|nr:MULTISPECIES: sigma 54-interacting transcriptional regulator [Alkalispirochaeta]POR05223.1 Fis family transcriptional regulator [Alkalispirochaeta sphaeroplastigenens]